MAYHRRMRLCASCGEENADRARFCQHCAAPLLPPEEGPSEVRKVVTILFADVTGSTALGLTLVAVGCALSAAGGGALRSAGRGARLRWLAAGAVVGLVLAVLA